MQHYMKHFIYKPFTIEIYFVQQISNIVTVEKTVVLLLNLFFL